MISSKRLDYHRLENKHFSDYASWYADDQVMRHITGRGLTADETKTRFQKALQTNQSLSKLGWYVTYLTTTGEFVGIAKATPYEGEVLMEIGYGSLPKFWHQGFGMEMAEKMHELVVEMVAVEGVVAIVDPENPASIRILEKLGFLKSDGELEGGGWLFQLKLK